MIDDQEAALREALVCDLNGAFRRLVLSYQDQLYTFSWRLTGSGSDAQDLVQDALLGAYVTLSQYPPARIRTLKLKSWLYKVLLNVFRNTTRGAHLLMIPLVLDDEVEQMALLADIHDGPELLYEKKEQRAELERALAHLPDYYRLIVNCYYFEGFSYQEIADLLDQPLGTVKSRLNRGLKLLRSYLQTTGLPNDWQMINTGKYGEQRRKNYGA